MVESQLEETLRRSLQALVQRILAEVRVARDSGRIVLERQRYILRPDYSLHYSVDRTILNFDLEEGEEELWDRGALASFLKEQIAPLPEYSDVLRLVETSTQGNSLLEAFAW